MLTTDHEAPLYVVFSTVLRPSCLPSAPCSRKPPFCASHWTWETKFHTRTEKRLHADQLESVRWCFWNGTDWRETSLNWNRFALFTVMKINKIGNVQYNLILWHVAMDGNCVHFVLLNTSWSVLYSVEVLPWECYNMSPSVSNILTSSCRRPIVLSSFNETRFFFLQIFNTRP